MASLFGRVTFVADTAEEFAQLLTQAALMPFVDLVSADESLWALVVDIDVTSGPVPEEPESGPEPVEP